jgi:hypothetical protein
MLLLKETSKWPDSTPNHTYVVSDNKEFVYGYIKQGALKIEMFKNRSRFHQRYRKFRLLGAIDDAKVLKLRVPS